MNTKFKISAIRNNLGLTQDEMAKQLNVSRKTYIAIERDPIHAEMGFIVAISKMSGVPLNMIDYGENHN